MRKFFAFTLAEVLITLGVIGVVAVLTIPAVISHYEKKVIEEGFKKTYSDLYNLIKRSEADNGTYEEWDYTLSSANFVAKYFAPYINLTECKGHNGKNKGTMPCFAGSDGIFQDDSRLNNSSYGITGCSKDIGSQSANYIYEIAGSGCSAKYLME